MSFNLMSLVREKPTFKLTRLEFLVLMALKRKPLHGYAIMKKLEQKLPGVWQPKSGSLYPLLRRMEGKGLLESKVIRGKKKYRLTHDGHDASDQYIKAWKELYMVFKDLARA